MPGLDALFYWGPRRNNFALSLGIGYLFLQTTLAADLTSGHGMWFRLGPQYRFETLGFFFDVELDVASSVEPNSDAFFRISLGTGLFFEGPF